ncbi:preprotein translocase subunit SecY [Rickettsiales bacterium Ac37b]|nr:preprotein translocase subunit SecY [Rickettsiales bacterium Ac37b]
MSTTPALDFSLFSKAHELKNRVLFTLLMLIIFRIGSYIPIPGVNPKILADIASQNSSGILGMFNMLSGGALGRMSVFALAIVPYITASIVIQLMTSVSKALDTLKKEGEFGRKRINQYTRYLTVVLCVFQGLGIALSLEHIILPHGSAVINAGMFFRVTSVVTLVGGTMFLMWVGEQITSRGIGNGISLIIFSGIVAGIPNAVIKTLELSKAGAISSYFIIILLVVMLFIVGFVIFVERAQRKIIIQYPKRQVGNKIYGGENSHLPLKLNIAGVIPPIFASSILLFPMTIANFTSNNSEWLEWLNVYLGHGKLLYIILYITLISIFCFFYTAIIFNPEETADNLRKYGSIIPGRRPGKNTAEYLDYVITRLTVIGTIYIVLVCVLPEILISRYSIPFYLGGTSILIVVNVVIDTMTQVQTHLFAHQYKGLMKKAKLREKK